MRSVFLHLSEFRTARLGGIHVFVFFPVLYPRLPSTLSTIRFLSIHAIEQTISLKISLPPQKAELFPNLPFAFMFYVRFVLAIQNETIVIDAFHPDIPDSIALTIKQIILDCLKRKLDMRSLSTENVDQI
jgi:hypothetical protein